MATVTLTEPVTSELTPETPSLRSNFRWMFAGNVFYAACQWGMLSILAKAGSPAIVGQFALGLAISAPVFMFTNLQLRTVQATDALSDFAFSDYFTLRILSSLVGLVTVAIVASFLHYDFVTRSVIVLIAAAKAIESLGDAVAGLLQKVERIHQVAISLMLRGALSFAAFGIAFLKLRTLIAAVSALLISWSIVFLGYDSWRAFAALDDSGAFLRFRPALLRRLLAISAPLGIVMTLFSLNTNIPRYLLAKFLGDSQLGVFASLAYILQGLYLLVNALGESASARLSRMFTLKDIHGFRRVIRELVWIGVGILVLGPILAKLFGGMLLTILYRREYADSLSVFVVVIIAGGITAIASFLGYGINAARRFRLLLPVTAFSTLTTAVLTALLAPRLGIMGAALALLAAGLVLAVGNAIALRSVWREFNQLGMG